MGVMDRFERRLDRLVNRPFAKAFKSDVHPVEIAASLQRECDDRAAIVARGRTMVPNHFTVELGQRDYERLSVYSAPLAAELAAMVREHATEQRYAFVGPVEVDLELADDLDTGMFRIRSSAEPGVVDQAGPVVASTPDKRQAAYLEHGSATYSLRGSITTLGRGNDVDLRIDDPGVSRRHLEIVLGGIPRVNDLGSTNGTYVNGQRVTTAELHDGANIGIGGTTLVFRVGEA